MEPEKLELIVITDAHYYSKVLGTDSPSYESFRAKSQKCVGESEEIITAAFAQIAKSRCKNVIFCGDATCDGDAYSHAGFLTLLRALKNCGKNVFAITSTHDYRDSGITYKYTGNEKEEIPALSREDMKKLYGSFGPEDAVSIWEDGLSYVSELGNTYTLFALNSDKNGSGRSGFSPEMLSWIKENAENAKKQGRKLLAFTHHPLISPSPVYSIIGKNDMMGGYSEIREQLSDMGFELVFTGHSHINDVSYVFSGKGKVLYDVSGSALAGYPAYIRYVTVSDEGYRIESRKITEAIPVKLNGKDLDEHLKNQFFGVIDGFLAAPDVSTDELAAFTNAISISTGVTYRFAPFIRFSVKLLKKLTLGHLHRAVKRKVPLKEEEKSALYTRKLTGFIKECTINLYAGNAPYSPATPEYRTAAALCSIIDGIPGVSRLTRSFGSLSALVMPLIFNSGIDDCSVFLPSNATPDDIKGLCSDCTEPVPDRKTGRIIFAILLLLLPVTLCIIMVFAAVSAAVYAVNYLKNFQKIRGAEK